MRIAAKRIDGSILDLLWEAIYLCRQVIMESYSLVNIKAFVCSSVNETEEVSRGFNHKVCSCLAKFLSNFFFGGITP